ncbi:hypothetical protein ACVBEG_03040 [Pseudomonas sp. GG8]
MLSFDETAELAGAICATAETLGQTISANAAKLMAEDLSTFDPNDIQSALRSCRKELSGKLTLAAILSRIQAVDGRPGKDEAWAIALTSSDETDTVVMTDEIQVALGAARSVLNIGDKVGARMAFIGAYERLVSKARDESIPVNWHVSIGFDANRRIEAISAAVQMKRITQEAGILYLSDLNVVPVTQDGLAIAGLITGKVATPSPEVRERLKAISQGLKVKARQKEAVKAHQSRLVRKDLNDRINRQLKAADEYQARVSP